MRQIGSVHSHAPRSTPDDPPSCTGLLVGALLPVAVVVFLAAPALTLALGLGVGLGATGVLAVFTRRSPVRIDPHPSGTSSSRTT